MPRVDIQASSEASKDAHACFTYLKRYCYFYGVIKTAVLLTELLNRMKIELSKVFRVDRSFYWTDFTAKKRQFSIKDFFSKYNEIRRKLFNWAYLLKKTLMENFIFCAVIDGCATLG